MDCRSREATGPNRVSERPTPVPTNGPRLGPVKGENDRRPTPFLTNLVTVLGQQSLHDGLRRCPRHRYLPSMALDVATTAPGGPGQI